MAKAKTYKGELDKVQQRAFDTLCDKLNTLDLTEVAKEARVSYATLHNWTHGKTTSPRFITMCKVAKVLGFEITIQKIQVQAHRKSGLKLVKW